jgi:hypothetical protein
LRGKDLNLRPSGYEAGNFAVHVQQSGVARTTLIV